MIRRIIVMFVQRYLWGKLRGGTLKSKVMTVASIGSAVMVLGSLFAMFSFDMTFVQGAGWTWGYLEQSSYSLMHLFF
ncbi:MAG: hypothetical protein KAG19_07900 [Methylococcales bacterium]|nr:hypothetical protein [Methylococcales bacterium]